MTPLTLEDVDVGPLCWVNVGRQDTGRIFLLENQVQCSTCPSKVADSQVVVSGYVVVVAGILLHFL